MAVAFQTQFIRETSGLQSLIRTTNLVDVRRLKIVQRECDEIQLGFFFGHGLRQLEHRVQTGRHVLGSKMVAWGHWDLPPGQLPAGRDPEEKNKAQKFCAEKFHPRNH
jgi:hypothetical protein